MKVHRKLLDKRVTKRDESMLQTTLLHYWKSAGVMKPHEALMMALMKRWLFPARQKLHRQVVVSKQSGMRLQSHPYVLSQF